MNKERALIRGAAMIAEGIYSMTLSVSFAPEVKPGQFVSLYMDDKSHLLPRPISIAWADPAEGSITLVYRIAGEGTRYFAQLTPGDEVSVMGPLGNSFPVEAYQDARVLLVGGGIGIPPMLCCGRALAKPVFAVGYRSESYLLDELLSVGEVHVATEDGSLGVKGNVLDAIRQEKIACDAVFACGPKPMLAALKAWAAEEGLPLYISMEERMACGIGACLACVAKTTDTDGHSHVKNTRICKDGPVFEAGAIDLG